MKFSNEHVGMRVVIHTHYGDRFGRLITPACCDEDGAEDPSGVGVLFDMGEVPVRADASIVELADQSCPHCKRAYP